MKGFLSIIFSFFVFVASSQVSRKITRLARKEILNDSVFADAHLGICIYDPSREVYIYNYNEEKNFIPASTVKLFTLYAAKKHLGDSITGIYYKIEKDTLFVLPSGDPTFMHPDFEKQPVHDFLNNSSFPVIVLDEGEYPEPYGKGWLLDDLDEVYMPQRSILPVYGNLFSVEWNKNYNDKDSFPYTMSMISSDFPDFSINRTSESQLKQSRIHRLPGYNHFESTLQLKNNIIRQQIPFETFGLQTGFHILKNTLYHSPRLVKTQLQEKSDFKSLYSQSTDTVCKLMMHRSDNFYAEQLLMMAGEKFTGMFNDQGTIDSLLKTDFSDIPQQPRWVDGSGLSRYNLFSPKDEIYILRKLKDNLGIETLKQILPTGGEGTLKNIFSADTGTVFAKTGSMSNNYCISGVLYTESGKELFFSIMVNNYTGKSSEVKKSIERFVHSVKDVY